jgi:methylenetetrahydrofolate reductase (NADPH)
MDSGSFQVLARLDVGGNVNLASAVDLASSWKGRVDAILVSDNASARLGMSAITVADRLNREGLETILTLCCRDRNRMALASTVLAAGAVSLTTVFCVSGVHLSFGDHPEAKPVYDMDSVQLISMIRTMEQGRDSAGNPIEPLPHFCVGAAAAAAADPLGPQLAKTRKKITAGADFLITLPIFSAGQLDGFLEGLGNGSIKVFAGLALLPYSEISRYEDGSIPGTFIPGDPVASWKDAGEETYLTSSLDHTKRLIAELKASGKVAGVCVTAPGREAEIERLLRD